MSTDKKQSLGKTFSLVALLTSASKFVGLARDIFLTKSFGTSMVSDAFNFATLFTGNILVLFGGLGGPFHSSCVAVLTPRKDSGECGRLTMQLLVWTAIIMGLISIAVFFLAPYIVPLVAPGSGDLVQRERLWQETTSQLRIMSPLILIAGLVGIGCGVSNTYNQFFWPSMAPAVASIAMIIACLFVDPDAAQRDKQGYLLALGALIGAIGQLLVQLPGMLKATPTFKGLKVFTSLEPGTREYLHMLWPATISTSIGYLYSYVDAFFASTLQEGAWTGLITANRLVQLPLGVLLTAMLVPILPRFTMQVAEGKIDDLKVELRKSLNLLWFLALPMSAILLAVPTPIVRLLFERGQFDAHSTALVTVVLLYLVPSIFFYVARDLITRVFYAHKDSNTPYHVGLCAIGVKLLITWLMVRQFNLGLGGVALSTSLITVFNLSLLSFFLRRKIGRLGASKLVKPVASMLFASLACALSTAYLYRLTSPTILQFNPGLLGQGLSLALAAGLGGLIYLALCYLFKIEEINYLIKRLRK